MLVMVLGDSLRLVRDFRGEPLAPLSSAISSLDFGTDVAADISAAFDLTTATRAESQWGLQVRILKTIDALEAVGASFRGVPGRKNLLWISDMFPDPRSVGGIARERAQKVWKTFAAEDISIYPIDARGVTTDPRFDPGNGYLDPRDTVGGVPGPGGTDLAEQSGGRAFRNQNDLAGMLRAAVADSRVLYTFAFYADAPRGRQRSIHIAVNRVGVHLQYRPIYYDEDALLQPKEGPQDEKARILAALGSPRRRHRDSSLREDSAGKQAG